MTFHLKITPAANRDVDDIAAYIAKDSIPSSTRFLDSVLETYLEILKSPAQAPLCDLPHKRLKLIRRKSIKRFRNYLIFYQVVSRSVEIVRVIHGSRDLPYLLKN